MLYTIDTKAKIQIEVNKNVGEMKNNNIKNSRYDYFGFNNICSNTINKIANVLVMVKIK